MLSTLTKWLHALVFPTLPNATQICSVVVAQAHCVREQAANYGDFRQRMLWGAEEAIRSAGAQLAVPTALYYQETLPPAPLPTAKRAA